MKFFDIDSLPEKQNDPDLIQIYLDYKKKCKVKVENPKLNRTTMEIEVGSTDYLTLDGCSHEVEWFSDDDCIADIDEDGTVYGEEAGTTTITASVHGKEYVCTVVVKERQ